MEYSWYGLLFFSAAPRTSRYSKPMVTVREVQIQPQIQLRHMHCDAKGWSPVSRSAQLEAVWDYELGFQASSSSENEPIVRALVAVERSLLENRMPIASREIAR
jgi:hypothetical protein